VGHRHRPARAIWTASTSGSGCSSARRCCSTCTRSPYSSTSRARSTSWRRRS